MSPLKQNCWHISYTLLLFSPEEDTAQEVYYLDYKESSPEVLELVSSNILRLVTDYTQDFKCRL